MHPRQSFSARQVGAFAVQPINNKPLTQTAKVLIQWPSG